MKKSNFRTWCLSGVAICLLYACGGDEAPKKPVYDYDRADSLSVDYLRELGNIRVSIEETGKLNLLLKDKGYSFNSSLLISPGKASGFSNSRKQALGLGAFGSDLNYSIAFEQTQDAMNYIKSIVDLSNKLGIPGAFDEELLSKISEPDSSIDKSVLLTKAYLKAEDQMYAEDRAQLATMMVTGGWVEGLYVAVANLKEKPGDSEINENLWNLAYSYKNVVEMLKVFESNTDCKEIQEELKIVSGPVNKIINSQGKINSTQLEELHSAISELRNKLID